ncbi:MAG: amidoligase family protein [Desulfocucumaceae bacterium]
MPKGRTGRGGGQAGSITISISTGGGGRTGGGAGQSDSSVIEDVLEVISQAAATVDQDAAAANQLVTGPFDVDVPSRTRGGSERLSVTFVSADEADVTSGSGRVYRTGVNRCSCSDYIYRRGGCRHMEALNSAVGMRGRGITGRHTPAGGIPGPEQTVMQNEEHRNLQELDAAEEQHRRERLARWDEYQRQHDDGLYLSRDEEAFESLQELARDGSNIEYEYENVLGGSENTFGIEIEFTGADINTVARELHAAGLVSTPRRGGYHAARTPGMWAVERDGSVSDGDIGGEVISPVLRDTPETWRQLERVCEIVRRNGGRVDMRCGGHVHVGADPLDESTWRWMRLARIASGFEDVIYRMAAGGESQGRHRGEGGGFRYSAPVPEGVGRFFHDRRVPQSSLISEVSPSRYFGLNLRNVGPGQKNTVEFRHFNGTLDPKQIQANVKIANAVVHAAENLRRNRASTRERAQFIPNRPNRLGTNTRSGGDERHSQVRTFVDTIFNNSRDKAMALWLYATSRWQSR